MRLLFLSNFYPPADLGGWEQWCAEVADALIARGHEVVVLTSNFRAGDIARAEPFVHRELHLESDLVHYRPLDCFLALPRRDRDNTRVLETTIASWLPDVVVIWGMWQLSPTLATRTEQLCPGRVSYYLCGYWPIEPDPHTQYWHSVLVGRGPIVALARPVAKLVLKGLARSREGTNRPAYHNAACVSQAVLLMLRAGGAPMPNARVIYGGIQLQQFVRARRPRNPDRPLRMLYAGSLSTVKGVDTALLAVTLLAKEFAPEHLHLTLVGAGHPEFRAWAQQYLAENRLERYVTLSGRVERSKIPDLLQEFDVLLFPSVWEEPLARIMMEGMAAELALVSTTTGGSKEFLRHGENCLTFATGDEVDLAHQIERFLREPDLLAKVAGGGQKTAIQEFDFRRMVCQLESFWQEIASRPPPDVASRSQQRAANQI
jgi:glycogen synthase